MHLLLNLEVHSWQRKIHLSIYYLWMETAFDETSKRLTNVCLPKWLLLWHHASENKLLLFMIIIMCIYIISFSEELKPVFAYSAAPLICKSQKTTALLFREGKCVRKAQAYQSKSQYSMCQQAEDTHECHEATLMMFHLSTHCQLLGWNKNLRNLKINADALSTCCMTSVTWCGRGAPASNMRRRNTKIRNIFGILVRENIMTCCKAAAALSNRRTRNKRTSALFPTPRPTWSKLFILPAKCNKIAYPYPIPEGWWGLISWRCLEFHKWFCDIQIAELSFCFYNTFVALTHWRVPSIVQIVHQHASNIPLQHLLRVSWTPS